MKTSMFLDVYIQIMICNLTVQLFEYKCISAFVALCIQFLSPVGIYKVKNLGK